MENQLGATTQLDRFVAAEQKELMTEFCAKEKLKKTLLNINFQTRVCSIVTN